MDRPELCRFFRNKHMFVPEQAVTALEPTENAAVAHCWCNRTMTCIGEDDRIVSLESCSNVSRTCYEAL